MSMKPDFQTALIQFILAALAGGEILIAGTFAPDLRIMHMCYGVALFLALLCLTVKR
mgnify:CR=1 FL=1